MTNNSTNRGRVDLRENGATRTFHQVVAIDGPAAAGKTTVALAVADRLGAMLFDTGVLYRAVTLAAVQRGIPDNAADQLRDLARSVEIEVRPPTVDDGRLYNVVLDGNDVTWAIRGAQVETHVSAVSAHPAVRQALLPLQRRIAASGLVVMVGRDIGSVVVPEAGLKVYLDASVEERARRRYRELRDRGETADYQTVLAAMRGRDAIDAGRATAPLRIADNALVIDTDHRSVDSIVDEIAVTAAARGIGTGQTATDRR